MGVLPGRLGGRRQGATALRAAVDQQRNLLERTESGAGAMIVGSALALLAVQRLLGIAVAADDPRQRPDASWQLDLDSPTLPRWSP